MIKSQAAPKMDPQVVEARTHYRRLISTEVEQANLDRLVVIDLDSDDFEIGDDLIELVHVLKGRRPNARVTGFRIGEGGRAVDRIVSFRIMDDAR